MDLGEYLNQSELAEVCGTTVAAIRYAERQGRIPPATLAKRFTKLYGPEDCEAVYTYFHLMREVKTQKYPKLNERKTK